MCWYALALGIPLLRRQEPPIRGVGHLDGRVPQRLEPRLVDIRPWGGDIRGIALLLLSSVCELLE